jgi:SAM-dependent methyltransferase
MSQVSLRLRRPLPSNRSYEQLLNHYRVEKEIADRLKAAGRAGRSRIYAGMYAELFARVPDHPRLAGASDPAAREARNRKAYALVERFVGPETDFVEFAPGDCSFAYLVCGRARIVIGVDISDQSVKAPPAPGNFTLRIYDGFSLDLPDGCADVVFSDQFIEHLHPDDADLHFQLVRRLLKPGGSYIFRTPHAYHGPFDISAYFSDVAEGFHLKEWTYRELRRRLRAANFSSWRGGLKRKGRYHELPVGLFAGYEKMIGWLPCSARRIAARVLLPRHIYLRAVR